MNGARVLVVDDDPHSLAFLDVLLSKEGARVSAFGTAREALAALATATFDLLVFDLILPDMRGDELLRAARMLHPRSTATPALAVTGYGSTENQIRVERAGFRACLYKPFDAELFLTSVCRLIRPKSDSR